MFRIWDLGFGIWGFRSQISVLRSQVLPFVFAFLPSLAAAAAVKLEAQISDGQVSVGQEFVYQVTGTFSGAQGDLSGLQMPDFAGTGLTVTGETRQSMSQMRINASVEMKIATGRTLMAPKEGTYTIPPARLIFEGQTFASNPATVVVAKPALDKLPQTLRNENILPARTDYPSLNRQLEGHVFLRPTAGKTDPFEGEPVLVTYSAFSDLDSRVLNLADRSRVGPEVAGLQGADFEIYPMLNLYSPPGSPPSRLTARPATIDGKTFQTAVVYQAYCIPKKPGTLSLGPYLIRVRIPVEGGQNSRFPFPFFDDNFAEAVLPTLPLEIHAKPLPAQGRPANFDNIIGEFTIKAELDRQTMNEDDLGTLKVAIRGRGHVGSIGQPKMPALEDFEAFDSTAKEDPPQGAEDGLRGGKVVEYVLRAKRPGALTIPPISLTVFNPWKAAYERLATEPITVQVAPSTSKDLVIERGQGEPGRGPGEAGIRKLAEGLAYIQTAGFARRGPGGPLYQQPWFLALQTAPVFLLAGVLALRRRRDRLERDVGLARRRGAGAAASRRLRKAAALSRGADGDAFYAELSSALRGFFADKFNRPASGIVIEEIAGELSQRAIEAETVLAVRQLLERCDQARFAPGSGEPQAMREALDEAGRLIGVLARRI